MISVIPLARGCEIGSLSSTQCSSSHPAERTHCEPPSRTTNNRARIIPRALARDVSR